MTQPEGLPLVVHAVLTVQVGRRRRASAPEPLVAEVLPMDALLDVVLQRAVGHSGPASDSRRQV